MKERIDMQSIDRITRSTFPAVKNLSVKSDEMSKNLTDENFNLRPTNF